MVLARIQVRVSKRGKSAICMTCGEVDFDALFRAATVDELKTLEKILPA
jgi:hypothetical protein